MKFYHYTCIEHLEKILADGEIKTTGSNLLKPVNPKIVNGVLVDTITDSYKPVVWLTSFLDFDRANSIGVLDKTEAAIQIDPVGCFNVLKWDKWALANEIEKSWFDALKRTAPEWDAFYVVENPIKIGSDCRIIFRPDIMEQLKERGATK